MIKAESQVDVVVVGGGLAGTCAAIAAARMGSKVALIQNRPVLGGNSSSEVRVWVVGATAHGAQRFARETGIVGELVLENQYRNPEGNPYYWDQVLLDAVRSEPNISLHLNTDVREVRMHEVAPGQAPRIAAVVGWTMGSEIETVFAAPVFLDCSGDGLIGHLAGAGYRVGRESRAEFDEAWAPDTADQELLGSSLFFYTKDAGRPERFVAPLNAKDIRETPIVRNRILRTGDNGCDYWWIEWGGHLDTVSSNEQIRDELWAVVYGIWDYIKNSGEFDADRLTLEWVGAIPGKREYRRFWGDYTITQQDLLSQTDFDDAVAFGGWSIDLHPVEGVYAEKAGALQRYSDGIYQIPFRSLYSRDVANLLFAGRNISASHIAFGSTRVMATCATQGQAVGTAASLLARNGWMPRELAEAHMGDLHSALLREDAPVFGVVAADPLDLAQRATAIASSEMREVSTRPHRTDERLPLDRDIAVMIPVDPAIEGIDLDVVADRNTTLHVELWSTGKPQNAVPVERITGVDVDMTDGATEVFAALAWHPERPANAVVIVRANPHASLVLTDERPYGVLAMGAKRADDVAFDAHIPDADHQLVTDWNARMLRRRSIALRAVGDSDAWSVEKVVDGSNRPYGGPRMWSSQRVDEAALAAAPEWIELRWPEAVPVASVRLVWNDDVDEDLINLHHHRTDFEAMPELVADYELQAQVDGEWSTIAEVTGNRHRHRIHDVEPVVCDALRVRVRRTNGYPYVTLSSVRVYSEPSGRDVALPW